MKKINPKLYIKPMTEGEKSDMAMVYERKRMVSPKLDSLERVNIEPDCEREYLNVLVPVRRYQCSCGSINFNVLHPGSFETVIQCTECSSYYLVHEG